MSKQDRQGVRTPAELEQKYNFGKSFAEIMGIATDAQHSVETLNVELRQAMAEQYTSMIRDSERIVMTALENYTETADYQEFKQTVETQFSILAGEIQMNFTNTSNRITDVDNDQQEQFTKLYKFISFTGEDGITIGTGDNAITLTLDTDGIVFSKNGTAFGRWDGNDFYTGNIIVRLNERAQFGNFAFIPRSDGSTMFSKVGE